MQEQHLVRTLTPEPSSCVPGQYLFFFLFTGCRLAGHNGNSEGVSNEESVYHPDIFVCGPPREAWPELWATHRNFG